MLGDQRGGAHAVKAAEVSGELEDAEIDHPVQLAQPVVEVRPEPVAMAHELAERLGGLVEEPSRPRGASRRPAARAPASIASVMVRARLASWKRRAVNRFRSATS